MYSLNTVFVWNVKMKFYVLYIVQNTTNYAIEWSLGY